MKLKNKKILICTKLCHNIIHMKKYIIPITDLRKTNDILDLSKDQQPICENLSLG